MPSAKEFGKFRSFCTEPGRGGGGTGRGSHIAATRGREGPSVEGERVCICTRGPALAPGLLLLRVTVTVYGSRQY